MPAPLTRTFGRFAAELSFDALPPEAVAPVKVGFTDCIAVMLAGVREPVAQIVKTTLVRTDPNGEARIFLGHERASAVDAALANGAAAHALDYDDVALSGHPSAVLVPAIMAEAEAIGASGRAAIAAYVAGYELWAHLIERDPDPYHRKGWHPTAVLGPVAAAAAIANLRRLDAEQAATAIAIAASMSAGLVANFGTMTKPYHAGRAAGIAAARLAQAGMTASLDAIEHPLGLLAALSPHNRVDRDTPIEDLGRNWRVAALGVNVKKYPICYATHRSIDAILDLAKAHDLKAADITQVDVSIGRTQATMLKNHRPQTGLEAKFSIEFAMASSLIARRTGLSELTDDFVLRPDVQTMMQKVAITQTDTVAADDPSFAVSDRVEVALNDGRRLASPEVTVARGHWSVPLSTDDLWAKFSDCAGREFGDNAMHALFDDLQSLDRLDSVRNLQRAAEPAAA